jgi:hypothetical protein
VQKQSRPSQRQRKGGFTQNLPGLNPTVAPTKKAFGTGHWSLGFGYK